jgi:hypothetical protein
MKPRSRNSRSGVVSPVYLVDHGRLCQNPRFYPLAPASKGQFFHTVRLRQAIGSGWADWSDPRGRRLESHAGTEG